MAIRTTCKVMLVDDDPAMIRLLSKMITRNFDESELQVEQVDDPQEAQSRLSSELFDVLVTDFDMPEVSGLDLLRTAKRSNPSCQVLLLTGMSSQSTLLEAMEAGAVDYLMKPVSEEVLVEAIQQARKRHSRWKQALANTWQKQNA